MIPPQKLLLSMFATTLLGGFAQAQTPRNPPPWWGVNDDRTLSLYFDFNALPLIPQLIGGQPSWYNPAVTQATITGPLQIIPNLTTHQNVLGLAAGAAPALLELTVDNDPHLNWVKIFFFQFDVFEGAAGSIIESLEQDLLQYERSSMTWETESLGNGWETVTINAELWPQPDDEGIDWSFLSDLSSDTGIDNLFVNSKCIKIEDGDEGGKGMGEVDQTAFAPTGLNLFQSTGEFVQAVAVTHNPGQPRTYWVSARAQLPGNFHSLRRLDSTGTQTSALPVPFNTATAPNGISDLTPILRRPTPSSRYEAVGVYGLVYGTAGNIQLIGFDLNGLLLPAVNVVLPALAQQDYGLAYNPSGDSGLGTFVITDPTGPLNGTAYEVAMSGVVLDTFAIPPGTRGAGYDHVFGNYYFWTDQLTPTPAGQFRTTGYVFSAYDKQPTGTRFWGSLAVPHAGVPGGVAAGMDVYRRPDGSLRLACVVESSQNNRLYELHGPWKFGQSLHGRTRMSGLPFEASTNFDIILDGIKPEALVTKLASLIVGFNNTNSSGTPLPFTLAPFGFDESQIVVALDMQGPLLPQAANGEFRFTMPALPSGFSGSRLHFQWIVFDPTVQNGIAMSSAGKTLIY